MREILKYKGYIGVVKYSPDDTILYGEVIGISDLISYEGNSIENIENDFKKAVNSYLETCIELGKEPNVILEEDLEDLGLLLLMEESNRNDTVSKEEIMKILNNI